MRISTMMKEQILRLRYIRICGLKLKLNYVPFITRLAIIKLRLKWIITLTRKEV